MHGLTFLNKDWYWTLEDTFHSNYTYFLGGLYVLCRTSFIQRFLKNLVSLTCIKNVSEF
jgi:hypothetical protein